MNPFENDEGSGSKRTMHIGIGVVVLGLAFVGYKLIGSSGPAATATPPQAAANANVLVPMTSADVQKLMPVAKPTAYPTLSKDFKLTPDMIRAQQKAYRERFGNGY